MVYKRNHTVELLDYFGYNMLLNADLNVIDLFTMPTIFAHEIKAMSRGFSGRGDEWSIKIFNCSQNFNDCSLARAPQIFELLASSQSKFFISARARKKSQCSACSRMLAKTIRHPFRGHRARLRAVSLLLEKSVSESI